MIFVQNDKPKVLRKQKENGVKFGRPAKLTDAKRQEIYSRRQAGVSIGEIAKEFKLGDATIYRNTECIQAE